MQEYILSGIVESYVLGIASPEESAEFERMCAAHQEVRAARNAFEIQLEQRFSAKTGGAACIEVPDIFRNRNGKRSTARKACFAKPALIPRNGFARYVAAASLIIAGRKCIA